MAADDTGSDRLREGAGEYLSRLGSNHKSPGRSLYPGFVSP
jgi:hypothetical protein